MTDSQTDKAPHICANITTRLMGGEAFIMNLDTIRTYSLNETAAYVWSLIDGRKTIGDIVASVGEEYDVPHDVCESSVLSIVEHFCEEHLVDFPYPHER